MTQPNPNNPSPEMIDDLRSFFAVEAGYFMPTGFAKRVIAKVLAMQAQQPNPSPADELTTLQARLDAMREALTYYGETFCEGYCEGCPEFAEFSDDECSGCRAKQALAKDGEV